MSREFDLILFDADGTLFDFAASERLAFDSCMQSYAGAGNYEEAYRAYVEIGAVFWRRLEQGAILSDELRVGRWIELARRGGFTWSPPAIADSYLEQLACHGHVLDGAVDICRSLALTHTLGLVTNGFEAVQTQRLAASPLREFIDFVVTSEAVGIAKPARAMFERALSLASGALPPQSIQSQRVLMVGDSVSSDIAGGNAMGFITCWYNPTAQPPPLHVVPDYTIRDLRELTRIVRQPPSGVPAAP
ncbi:MAG TPA: YjjG family noncanonical pyrimidine nucleotidase [Polyangiaceae bacterium]|nr:YjjG family noncanonical pyrimidine nucleotidase [Polyangiaceae bacterium]